MSANHRTLDPSVFEYLKPTEDQAEDMKACREAAAAYATVLELRMPAGPDKTYALRKLREVAVWANIGITRNPDGSPRESS